MTLTHISTSFPIDDHAMMKRAFAEAERGRGWVEPNPMVGAVVVNDGRIVGVGHHEKFGGPHAEIHALNAAGSAARGSTVYVTLEPCCHHGKTPPCTDALIRAGASRVVVAVQDPYPRVAGGGIAQLRAAGIPVDVGVEERLARRLLAPFLKRVLTGRPYVIAKWAMTLDGRIATRTGDSQWISSPRSRSLVHEVRGRLDGIVVGIGTALADDPLLTARPAGPRVATRIILDSKGRLPVTSKLVQTAGDIQTLVIVTAEAPREATERLASLGCEILQSNSSGPIPIAWLLDELGRRGMTTVLVEGGASVLGSFFDAGEVDEVDVFIAPRIIGGRDAFSPIGGLGPAILSGSFPLIEPTTTLIAPDIRVQGMLPRPWLGPQVEAQGSSGSLRAAT